MSGIKLPTGPRLPVFTPNQQAIFPHLCVGKTDPEIATALGITLNAARERVRKVTEKLELRYRADVIAWLRQKECAHDKTNSISPSAPRKATQNKTTIQTT